MKLRWYQEAALDAIDAHFAEQSDVREIVIALPTGTGKSLVIAGGVKRIFDRWPNWRVMCLTHVKELIAQNTAKISLFWPAAPVGIYSAGLRRKDKLFPITVAGVASVKNCIEDFGRIDVLFIDEVHMVGDDETSMYQAIIAALRAANPYLVIIGLSATPFRLGQGLITDGSIFKRVVYDLCTPEGFRRLIDEGVLCPPITKRTRTTFDLSGVKMERGDFKKGQLERAMNGDDKVTYEALREALDMGADRHCWLAFCSGIEHAENVADMLRSMGVSAAAVHSKMKSKERDAVLGAFKSGEIKCLTNNGIFTTGQDHPPIDFIIGLRPTMSASLWVQMIGRGTRPYDFTNPDLALSNFDYTKTNVLVADFASNAERLGPIDDPVIPKKKGEGTGEPPVKICDHCDAWNHPRARYCGGVPEPSPEGCGAEFTFESKLKTTAAATALLSTMKEFIPPVVEKFYVDNVLYFAHKSKATAQNMLRVSYFCGIVRFDEYINFEAKPGMFLGRSHKWWRARFGTWEVPATNEQALTYIKNAKVPKTLDVVTNRKPPEIVGHDF